MSWKRGRVHKVDDWRGRTLADDRSANYARNDSGGAFLPAESVTGLSPDIKLAERLCNGWNKYKGGETSTPLSD